MRPPSEEWPLERVLFALAGTVILISVALAAMVSPWFLVLTAFVGVNLWLYVWRVSVQPRMIEARLHLNSVVYPETR